MLQDLGLEVPGLRRPRAVVDGVVQPVVRVVAPLLRRAQLREVCAPAELDLGWRGERRAGGGLVSGDGGVRGVCRLPRFL